MSNVTSHPKSYLSCLLKASDKRGCFRCCQIIQRGFVCVFDLFVEFERTDAGSPKGVVVNIIHCMNDIFYRHFQYFSIFSLTILKLSGDK